MPPATTIEALPVMMVWAPRIMAFRPEAHTLLTVVQMTDSERPAPRAHWRAGAWPRLCKANRQLAQFHAQQRATSQKRVLESLRHLLGRQDVAEKDLLDILRLDLRNTLNGSYARIRSTWETLLGRDMKRTLDSMSTQLGSTLAGELAKKTADWRPGDRDNVNGGQARHLERAFWSLDGMERRVDVSR